MNNHVCVGRANLRCRFKSQQEKPAKDTFLVKKSFDEITSLIYD